MTNNTIDLSRRRFYKSTDPDGKSFYQPVPHLDTEYKVGVETLPLQRSRSPRLRSAEALHGFDDPEMSIRYALYQMHNKTQRWMHNELWVPPLCNDDHPYGLRVFSFRGTPFDGADSYFGSAGGAEYGFTRIKPENERKVEDFFTEPSPLPLVNTDFDSNADLASEIIENLARSLFSGRKYGGYPKYLADKAIEAVTGYFRVHGRLDHQKPLDEMIKTIAIRHADRVGSAFWNKVSYPDGDDRAYEIKRQITREVEKHGYKAHGDNQWELRGVAQSIHTATSIADVDPDHAEVANILNAYENLTGPPKRLLLISVPNVETQTDRYHRTASLHAKIRNLVESEYDDLGEVEITATQA